MPYKNKYSKYIEELQKVVTIINVDQKQLLTANDSPANIADNIQDLQNIANAIKSMIGEITEKGE